MCGLAPSTEWITSLTGVDEAERLPGFLAWLKRPEVGCRLHATTDIFGSAYIAAIQGPDEDHLDGTSRLVRNWSGGTAHR